jgi:uncharacterized protein (DUF697 family)
MSTCKQEARRWVHRYAAGGSAFTLVPLPVTSASLTTLEMHMVAVIGTIYGESLSNTSVAAAGNTFAVLGQGLKWLAVRGAQFAPRLGPVLRVVIAAASIEGIGHAIIQHFERKYPGKAFAPPSPADAPHT